jgi:precorrin-6B methylase 2
MIVVSAITLETIAQLLAFIESHGEILDCSIPIV